MGTIVNYAKAAHYYRASRAGRFSVSGLPPLNKKQTAAYFLLALSYCLKDRLASSDSYPPFQMMLPALMSTSEKTTPLENGCQGMHLHLSAMLTLPDSGKSLSQVKISSQDKAKVYRAIMTLEHNVLTLEEIAEKTKFGVQKVCDAVRELEENPLPESVAISYLDGVVARGECKHKDYMAAQTRREEKYHHEFLGSMRKVMTELKDSQQTIQSIDQVFTPIIIAARRLGLRFFDVLLPAAKPGKWELHAQRMSVLQEAPNFSHKFLQSVADSTAAAHIVKIETVMEDIKQAGLVLDKTTKRLFKQLEKKDHEYFILLKAPAHDSKTQAILLITNPLFFGGEHEEDVLNSLQELADSVGRKIGEIRGEKNLGFQGHLEKSRDSGWITRNETEAERFYDRVTATMNHMFKMSPAYRQSVDQVLEEIVDLPVWQRAEGTIQILDAGMGPGNISRLVLQKAKDKGKKIALTMLDISRAACAAAIKNCQNEVEANPDVRQGSVLSMTSLAMSGAENRPVDMGSQDIVLLNYVLQYTSRNALAEINRVLKMGGRLIITNFKPGISMSADVPKINIKAAWRQGWKNAWLFGALANVCMFALRFLQHPIRIISFASRIDDNVKNKVYLPNPKLEELHKLAGQFGYNVVAEAETHEGAAIRIVLEKTHELDKDDNPIAGPTQLTLVRRP